MLDGFSKTYAMTGWRMGYGVMPAWCEASFTQRAGIAALRNPPTFCWKRPV